MADYGFEIVRMKVGSWGKTRAFFDLKSQDGFTIKGFKIVEGINGMFVSFPSVQDKDGNYNDQVFADKELKQKLNHHAIDYYKEAENGVGASETKSEDVPF